MAGQDNVTSVQVVQKTEVEPHPNGFESIQEKRVAGIINGEGESVLTKETEIEQVTNMSGSNLMEDPPSSHPIPEENTMSIEYESNSIAAEGMYLSGTSDSENSDIFDAWGRYDSLSRAVQATIKNMGSPKISRMPMNNPESHATVPLLGNYAQSWEEHCEHQLIAFLQVRTMKETIDFVQSPVHLLQRMLFKNFLTHMIMEAGNADFLSCQISSASDELNAPSVLATNRKDIVPQTASSSRHSFSSSTSQSSTSTINSFSSQISDGTTLNSAQIETRSLRKYLIGIQNRVKQLEKVPQVEEYQKAHADSMGVPALYPLIKSIEKANELLISKDKLLGVLGFSDISVLCSSWNSQLAQIYKDLKSVKQPKVLRPGRPFKAAVSGQETRYRNEKYSHIEGVVRMMFDRILAALETAEGQKNEFINAGKPFASVSIIEATSEMGYAPHTLCEESRGNILMTVRFRTLDDPLLEKHICECCSNNPKIFYTAEQLSAHQEEKPYACANCKRRFRMLSKLARHRNVAHLSLSPSPYYHGSIPKDFFVGNPFSVKEPKGSVSVASPVLDSEIERKAVFAGNEVAQKQAVQAKIILERNLKAEEMALAGLELAQKTVHEIYNKPILFKDAVGRKFSFPFHSCAQWEGMEKLIKQAFLHVDTIGPHVQKGHYDLIGPDETIILPQVWETTIQPGWSISMQLWPIPEPDVSDLEVPSNSKSQALASPPSDQSKSKDKKGMLNWMTRVSRLSKGRKK